MRASVESPPSGVPDAGREPPRSVRGSVASAENERIVISRYGPPDVLRLVREPVPVPRPGQVRIKVAAAGVSFGDVAQRANLFFAGAPPMPYTPGYDVVGTVDAIGDGVTDAAVGDRVAALTMFGGYARYVCAPSNWLVNVPAQLDASDAVAMVLNYTTAWQMLRRIAKVRRGDAVLVYGGSGGVGTALLDLARHLQLLVAAAAGKRWHDALRNQAALLFDERDPSAGDAVRQFRPTGFDAAFDGIGGAHIWRTRSLVARHGKVVAFGIAGAVQPGGKRRLTEVARLTLLLGFARLWPRPGVELYAMDRRITSLRHEINGDTRELIGLLASGSITPRIGATFALRDAARAHELLESRTNIGKIVLIP
jgi:NADPH:quinone reductase